MDPAAVDSIDALRETLENGSASHIISKSSRLRLAAPVDPLYDRHFIDCLFGEPMAEGGVRAGSGITFRHIGPYGDSDGGCGASIARVEASYLVVSMVDRCDLELGAPPNSATKFTNP